jgi:F-type H+-transporting ATPase subunit c
MALDIQTWVSIASYMGGAVAMGCGAIGAAIGEGFAASEANLAISRRPGSSADIVRAMLVGQAIAESAAIFALVIAMMLLFSEYRADSIVSALVLLSAGLSMGLGAIGSGVGSGFPAGAACKGMSRRPEASNQLTTNMLIGSAVCQTPAIFALVVSFILLFTDFSGNPISPTWAAILGAGLATGFGAIGSGLGGGLVAQASCEGIARQPSAATPVTNIMLLGQAVTQTTAIYGLLVSFVLMFKSYPASDTLASAMALLGAGLCMGIGAIGPAIGEGIVGRSAVTWIARNQENIGEITRTMLVGQAGAESTGIYSLVIALVLIFVM